MKTPSRPTTIVAKVFRALHSESNLAVYGISVIARDANAQLSVKQAETPGPLGLGVVSLVGGLIGLLGRSGGAAVGMSSDALLGVLTEFFNAGVGADFVRTVSQELPAGKCAVVAEVEENWEATLDRG